MRWTSFNRELQLYQGEIEGKAQFVRQFLGMPALDAFYDVSKLQMVLAAIMKVCIRMQEKWRIANIAAQYA